MSRIAKQIDSQAIWKLCQWEGWNPSSKNSRYSHPSGGGADWGDKRLETAGGGRQSRRFVGHMGYSMILLYNGLMIQLIQLRYPFYPYLSSRWHWKILALIMFFFDAVPKKNGGLPLPGLISRGYRIDAWWCENSWIIWLPSSKLT